MKKGIIAHEGVISSETESHYKVSITSRSACAACHAKGLCSASEMANKVIDVEKGRADGLYKVGDRVNVNLEESMGMKAVWIVYALPAIILVTFLLYLQRLTLSELVVGLSVLGAVAIYFIVLYLLRGRIGRSFHFSISGLEETTNK